MNKVKKFISDVTTSFQGTFKKYSVALILVFIVTIIISIQYDNENVDFSNIIIIGSTWALEELFIEELFSKKSKNHTLVKILSSSIAFLIATIFGILLTNSNIDSEILYNVEKLYLTFVCRSRFINNLFIYYKFKS